MKLFYSILITQQKPAKVSVLHKEDSEIEPSHIDRTSKEDSRQECRSCRLKWIVQSNQCRPQDLIAPCQCPVIKSRCNNSLKTGEKVQIVISSNPVIQSLKEIKFFYIPNSKFNRIPRYAKVLHLLLKFNRIHSSGREFKWYWDK